MWWVWILAALVCGIIEVMSLSFVFLMFAIGALAAGIAGAFGANEAIQVIVFVVVTVALLVGLRPFLKGRIERSAGDVRTNTGALLGKTGYVTEVVGERHGRIQFSGGEWSARTQGPELPVGAEVRVDRIDGATAVVSALNPSGSAPTQPSAGSAS
nr:NfeD family protein [uncultured Actinomyces sp.]